MIHRTYRSRAARSPAFADRRAAVRAGLLIGTLAASLAGPVAAAGDDDERAGARSDAQADAQQADAASDATPGIQVGQRALERTFRTNYSAFDESTGTLMVAVDDWCADPDDGTLASAREAFAGTVSTFSRIEPLRIGPMLQGNRVNRLFYWPDKRGAGERQLRSLVAETSADDAPVLDADALAGKSVAVQGLLALERLLYAKSVDAGAACAVAPAIGANIDSMAAAMLEEWRADDGVAAELASPGPDARLFRGEDEIHRSFITEAASAIESIEGAKLAPLIDGDARGVRTLPFVRSDLFVPALEGNVAGLRALLVDSGLARAGELEGPIEFELDNARRLLGLLGEQERLTDAKGVPSAEVQALATTLKAGLVGLRRALVERLAPALDVGIGFNSADGD